jgi:hypothetical protein
MMDLYAVSAWMMGWVCIIRFMGLSVSIGLVRLIDTTNKNGTNRLEHQQASTSTNIKMLSNFQLLLANSFCFLTPGSGWE